MSKQRKTVLKGYGYLQCNDFAAYLMEMARKGWHFREWRAGLVFERGEPKDTVYAVEVFVDGSEYDTRPSVHTREFAEYCETAGWKLVDAKRKFCIFQKVKPDAVEILTPEERLENIAKEEQKRVWQQLMLYTWFMVLQFLQFAGSGFVNRIFSDGLLGLTVLCVFLWLGEFIRCILFYLWKAGSQRKIRTGETIYFGKGNSLFSILNRWYLWISIGALAGYLLLILSMEMYLSLVYVALILIPLFVMAYCISRFRPDATTNQIIQIAVPVVIFFLVMAFFLGVLFTQDSPQPPVEEIPLLLEDIGGEAGALEKATLDGSSSILGSALRCQLYYEDTYVYYQIYQSAHLWILDRIWQDEMSRKYNQTGTDVSELWDAEEAIRNEWGGYLVRYDDAVLIFSFDEDVVLTADHIAVIRTALLESR